MNLKKSNKPLTAAKQDTFYYTSPKKLMGKCNSIKKRCKREQKRANDRKRRGIKQTRIN
jgi:hypothetical protein